MNAEVEQLLEQADSLDDSDKPFSQELQLSHSSTSSCEFQAVREVDTEVTETEVRSLHSGSYMTSQVQQTDTGATLREDLYSRLYYDFDDERYSREHWEDIETTQARDLFTPVSAEELEERTRAQRGGGLERWNYGSPFADVSVQIDNVNNSLERCFLEEANTSLDQVISDI